LPWGNAPAYLPTVSLMKKKSFIALTNVVNVIKLFSSAPMLLTNMLDRLFLASLLKPTLEELALLVNIGSC
jgi:hypothetical protein